jgi:hypothetical protein
MSFSILIVLDNGIVAIGMTWWWLLLAEDYTRSKPRGSTKRGRPDFAKRLARGSLLPLFDAEEHPQKKTVYPRASNLPHKKSGGRPPHSKRFARPNEQTTGARVCARIDFGCVAGNFKAKVIT